MALYLTAGPADTFVAAPQRDRERSFMASPAADISADGRFVAFESLARLVPADTDDLRDIYVLNRNTGQVTLESQAAPPASHATHPRLSGDGRYLVFETETWSGGAEMRIDIILCDRSNGTRVPVTSTSSLAHESANGSSHAPEISDDGRVVVFSSSATNLVPGPDANGLSEDVYLFEVQTRALRRVSVNSDGNQSAVGYSMSPSVSADGRAVAFASSAPLGAPTARRATQARVKHLQVYVRDETHRTTTQISVARSGDWPNAVAGRPAISGDGRYVAFVSDATNLVRDDRNGVADVFRHDRETGTTVLVSRAADGGSANGRSCAPSLSYDGRLVAFHSDASNIVCARRCPPENEDLNLLWDVLIADMVSNVVVRASDDALGGWMEPSLAPVLDAKGSVVAFSSRHPIDDDDRQNDYDLFVRKLDPQ